MKKSKINQLQQNYSSLERTNLSLLTIILPIGFILYAANDYLFRPILSVALVHFPKYTVISSLLAYSATALLIVSFLNIARAFTFGTILIYSKSKFRLMKDKLLKKFKRQAEAKQFLIGGIICLILYAFTSFHLDGLTKNEINQSNYILESSK